MSKPRVFSVEYSFHPGEGHDYSNATDWRGRLGDFDLNLSATVLLATPAADFVSEAQARAALEPHLRAWELRSDLEDGVPIRFTFEGSTVLDITPGEEGPSVFMGASASFQAEGSVVTRHGQFPAPAGDRLATSPLVEELMQTIQSRRDGQQVLGSAYLFLTLLEREHAGSDKRRKAAGMFSISFALLRKLGELSAVDDPDLRRKAGGVARRLTDAELKWIDEAMRRITLQVAELAAGGDPAQLTIDDLPPT